MNDNDEIVYYEGNVIGYLPKTKDYRIEYTDGERKLSSLRELLSWRITPSPVVPAPVETSFLAQPPSLAASYTSNSSSSTSPADLRTQTERSLLQPTPVISHPPLLTATTSLSFPRPSVRSLRGSEQLMAICACGCGREEADLVNCKSKIRCGICPSKITKTCEKSWRDCLVCVELQKKRV